jgi:glycosyltransferase involved in cell wall biosynthesis
VDGDAERFSVVVPVYNAGTALDAAVRSILDQTDQQFEVVIVDDFSTDDSYERALAWSENDERIKVARTSSNSGSPAEPRNLGLIRSRGAFVAFLDQDDRWLPTKLERQRAKFQSGDFALVYSACRVECPEDPGVDGRPYHDVWAQEPPREGFVSAEIVRADFVPMLTAVVRRDWADRVGRFAVGMAGLDDWHYWIRLALLGGGFGFVDQVLAVYRWSTSNLSHARPTPRVVAAAGMFRSLANEFPPYRTLLSAQERRHRQRAISLRLGRLPRPVRGVARTLLLPPRLWTLRG